AEQLMRAEINQLKADLKSQRDSMFAQIAALLGLSAGSRGSSLNSYSDTTSPTFISQEQQQKEINYYANLMMEGKIDHYSLIAAGLLGAEPGMGHEKWGVHPEALNPPAGIRSLVNIIKTNRPEPITSNTNLLVSIMNGSIQVHKDLPIKNAREFFMNSPSLDEAIVNFSFDFNITSTFSILFKCGFDGPSSASCAIPMKTSLDEFINNLLSTRWQTQDSINQISSITSSHKNTVNRLKRLTEITTSSQLISVLSEAKWGLNQQDLQSLGNRSGDVDNLTWDVNGQSLKFTDLVGSNGGAIVQSQELTDAYLMYQRGPQNIHIMDYSISGNEFLSALSTLAETQYTVVRDAYF
ncbi:hypothetical protein, partial [Leptospira yanagawae]|uniref:hypothetical protein n=1 Tax=Leptospira yanagawae TaxID=293069 RepID=UPI003CC826F0